jgi:hypothetical protein
MPKKGASGKKVASKSSTLKVAKQVQSTSPKASLDALGNESLALVDPSLTRALNRRDTEDAVDRLYETRLKDIAKERLAGATNSKGEKLRGFLLEAERKRRSDSKRFGAEFWIDIFQDFKLLSDWSDSLVEPVANENFDTEFLEKLDLLHSTNPAIRSPKPICQYLDICPPLNYSMLFGLAQAMQVSPVVTQNSYGQIMISLLGHVARIRKRHPWKLFLRFLHVFLY